MRTLVKEIKGGESWGLIDHDGEVMEKYSTHVRAERFYYIKKCYVQWCFSK